MGEDLPGYSIGLNKMKDWTRTFEDYLWLKPDDVGTEEAAFIRKTLMLRKGNAVLDVPCGAGRIAIHLAQVAQL